MTSTLPSRAPALYVTGYTGTSGTSSSHAGESPQTVTFRLPLPPFWEGPVEGVRAAERRARRAYFTVLDVMQRGRPAAVQSLGRIGQIQGFLRELRSESARRPLRHLIRIWRSVERQAADAGFLPPRPPTPLTSVVVQVPASLHGGHASTTSSRMALESRYAWAIEWLQARAYLATGRDLRVEWRVTGATPGRSAGPR